MKSKRNRYLNMALICNYMKWLTLLQLLAQSQSGYVQEAKHHLRVEIGHGLAQPGYYGSHWHRGQRVHRLHMPHGQQRWSGRRRSISHPHPFSHWTQWTVCDEDCVRRRERYCKVKRKCGHTKHMEQSRCSRCTPTVKYFAPLGNHFVGSQPPFERNTFPGNQPPMDKNQLLPERTQFEGNKQPQNINQFQFQPAQPVSQLQANPNQPAIIINAAAAASSGPTFNPYTRESYTAPHRDSVEVVHRKAPRHKQQHIESSLEEDDDSDDNHDEDQEDFFVLKKYRRRQRPQHSSRHRQRDRSKEDSKRKEKNRKKTKQDFIDDDLESLMEHKKSREKSKLDELDDNSESNEKSPKVREKTPPSQDMIDADFENIRNGHNIREKFKAEFDDDDFEDFPERRPGRPKQRSLSMSGSAESGGPEGDTFQYEDFDFEPGTQFEDSDEYADSRNATSLPPAKERSTPDAFIPRHRRIYSKWSRWSRCSPKCITRRYKKCRNVEQCGREVLREIAYCYTEGSFCQQWLQTQVQRTPAYEIRPAPSSATAMRRMHNDPTLGAMSKNDVNVIMSGKGYRGPEYSPVKLQCGLVRSGHKSTYNMLKIIGGKAARKGDWPWQVAIFNRFKEAFCGGTLIAPYWVLTAAHCVRRVLYVRFGEHNLDYEDGTEVQLRVLRTYKHPNFDKRTVDSDVALLRLPKAINASTWIGYSCLPRPYQPLPKNLDCTVIGWGKRRSQDMAGTSVLHQAEVPIINMENCRSVYHDYTITKNMFCAGHRRGRIDTCAGDSGGPLLCRDTTKANHPWTIFGITSFGDGCAKRNKFGIYAKVPNYVDWVWSVVNCNGNCKLQ